MENNNNKYKGFANAAEYVQDIQTRYAAFEAENAAYLADLKQREESGELDEGNYDPQDVMNIGKMIKSLDTPEHEALLNKDPELAHAFKRMKSSSEFYQKNDAFRKEMNEGMALLYADKIEAAQNMVTQMSHIIEAIKEYITENGSTLELVDRLKQLETAIMYLNQDMALSQLQMNALQTELQN